MRAEGNAYDSFVPHPIGEWAKWTYSESDRKGLRMERWRPRPGGGVPGARHDARERSATFRLVHARAEEQAL